VLIGPRTVLTAAHVVASVYSRKARRFTARVRMDELEVHIPSLRQRAGVARNGLRLHTSLPPLRIDGLEVISETDFNGYLANSSWFHDLALLRLDRPVGRSLAPYPRIADHYPGVQESYYFTGPLSALDAKLGRFFGIPTVITEVHQHTIKARVGNDGRMRDNRMRPGDSGGPLFLPGRDGQAAVLFGIGSSGIEDEWAFTHETVYARLDNARDWILKTRARFEGGTSTE